MKSVLTQYKFEWLRKVGFEVTAMEDSDGWIATRTGMTIIISPASFVVGPFLVDNWIDLDIIPFQFIIRGYMQQVLGFMPANDDEAKMNPNTGNGLFNTLS